MKTHTRHAACAACCMIACLTLSANAAPTPLEELTNAELSAASADTNGPDTTYRFYSGPTQDSSKAHRPASYSEAEMRAAYSERIGSVRLDETDKPLRLLYSVFPKYPRLAKAAGLEGLVEIELTVNEDGLIENARILRSPDRLLSDACLDAVTQWRFEPITRLGQPATVKMIQAFPFKLH